MSTKVCNSKLSVEGFLGGRVYFLWKGSPIGIIKPESMNPSTSDMLSGHVGGDQHCPRDLYRAAVTYWKGSAASISQGFYKVVLTRARWGEFARHFFFRQAQGGRCVYLAGCGEPLPAVIGEMTMGTSAKLQTPQA